MITFIVVVALTLAIVLCARAAMRPVSRRAVAKVEPLIVEILGPRELPKNIDLAALLAARRRNHAGDGERPDGFDARRPIFGWPAAWSSSRTAWPIPGRIFRMICRVPRFAALTFRRLPRPVVFLHGLAGVIAGIAAAALGVIFVLQGLAVVHDLSRGMRFRTALLCGLYLALGLLMPWPLVIFAVIGLVEAGFGLRDKKAAAAATHI